MITCSRCGRENADDARFCSNCGNALASSAIPGGGEARKTVTIMFMDAVGSTSLGERTDPESLRRVMTRYFDEIHAIVERHGGTVEKFIGDAVMAVYGVPTVHEDDALRAVRAALEIRDRLLMVSTELEQQRGTSIAWRTGINTGEVVAGDSGSGQRFVTGDAVNVAARLEQAAQAAEILLGQATHNLVRHTVVAEQTEPVTAKGKDLPLASYRLLALAVDGNSQARRLDSPMIGRQRQRRALADAYEQTVEERVCHQFTILGAAGVGKSRLVSEFLSGLDDGPQVLHGRCLSYGEGITYWPIAEAVRAAATIDDRDDNETVRRKIGALLDVDRDRDVAVERIGQLLGRFTGGSSRDETFWAVRTLLESLARRRPVVLLLDDIHWAEPTLLDLIEHLSDWIRDAPILLLCVARQELLELRPGWGGGKSYATTITLEPLSQEESRELMTNLLGQMELGADLLAKIGSSAEGNPLFVEEMIGMLIDKGLVGQSDGSSPAAAGLASVTVPPTIQALLAARLDGLPSKERAVLERGSVEGQIFHRAAVADLGPADQRDSVSDDLRALSRKELVRPDRPDLLGDDAFRFRHLLIRDAAYAAMPKQARADLHSQFADWLVRAAGEHLTEYEEIVAYHLEQAYRYRSELGPLDDEGGRLRAEATRYLRSSGTRASQRGDVSAASKLLEGALGLMATDDPDRFGVAAELADALNGGPGPLHAREVIDRELVTARNAGDDHGIALLELVKMGTLSMIGEVTSEEVIQLSERVLPTLREHGDQWGVELAIFELGRQNFFIGNGGLSVQIFEEEIARAGSIELRPQFAVPLFAAFYWGPTPIDQAFSRMAELSGARPSRVVEAGALRFGAGLQTLLGNYSEGRSMLMAALEIEEQLGRTQQATAAMGFFLGPLEAQAGNDAAAEQTLLTAYERFKSAGDIAFASTVACHIAEFYVNRGGLDEAERYARIALDTSTVDDVESQAQGRSSLGLVAARRGAFDEALTLTKRAVEISGLTDYLARRGSALYSLAEVMVLAGMRNEAVAAFRKALENYEAKGATALSERTRSRLSDLEATL